MAWLVVTGESGWGFGREWFPPGVHEVSDEVATAARGSGIRRLVLSEDRPKIVQKKGTGPLTLEDVKVGVPIGIAIEGEEEQVEEQVEDDRAPDEPLLSYHCDFCAHATPTQAALDRHIEFHHEVHHRERVSEEEAAAQAEADAKAARRRIEEAPPGELHPFERG